MGKNINKNNNIIQNIIRIKLDNPKKVSKRKTIPKPKLLPIPVTNTPINLQAYSDPLRLRDEQARLNAIQMQQQNLIRSRPYTIGQPEVVIANTLGQQVIPPENIQPEVDYGDSDGNIAETQGSDFFRRIGNPISEEDIFMAKERQPLSQQQMFSMYQSEPEFSQGNPQIERRGLNISSFFRRTPEDTPLRILKSGGDYIPSETPPVIEETEINPQRSPRSPRIPKTNTYIRNLQQIGYDVSTLNPNLLPAELDRIYRQELIQQFTDSGGELREVDQLSNLQIRNRIKKNNEKSSQLQGRLGL